MLVQPPKFIENSLSAKVNDARINGKVSSLDQPKIAAVHLKSKEDLALFYGESHTSAFTGVVVTAIQAVVAVIATAVAFAIKGGNSHGSSHELNDLPSEDIFDMDIHSLLHARRMALEVS